MVQAVAKAGMTPEARAQWADRVVNAVNAAIPYLNSRTGVVANGCSRTPRSAPPSSRNTACHRPSAARLLNQAGLYLQERARYAEAETLYRRGLAIAEKIFGPEDPECRLHALNNLAPC